MSESAEGRDDSRPSPADVATFLPHACGQLQAPFGVRVVVLAEEEYVSKADSSRGKKNKGKSRIRLESQDLDTDDTEKPASRVTYCDDQEVVVTAMLDRQGRLVEIGFKRSARVPRLLLKVLALCVPFQPALERFYARFCLLHAEEIHELAKLVSLSRLVEISLDDSPVREKNYHILFDRGQLRRLSFARCMLNDDDCAVIAAKLTHPLPASKSLIALSLTANLISDIGAHELGIALRSNRTLQYLNLAGNCITDAGAASIFSSLVEFPLTAEEVLTKRRRFMDFLQRRKEVYDRCFAELRAMRSIAERQTDESARSKRRLGTRSRKNSATTAAAGVSMADMNMRAEAMATETLGAYSDPYSREETLYRNDCIYSRGNKSLCALNLAHNNLGYGSMAALLTVLRYQAQMSHKTGTGLLRVLLEGNAMPRDCRETDAVAELLERAVLWRVSKPKKSEKSLKMKK